jgi:excisionase family DNA binding protein
MVAQRLGCSEWTVRRMIRRRELRAFRPGQRSWRVWEHELERYIKAHSNDSDGDE